MEPLLSPLPLGEKGSVDSKPSTAKRRRRDNQGDADALQGSNINEQRRSREAGRSKWSRDTVDRRARNDDSKQRRLNKADGSLPAYATEFSKEEIEAEGRRPKRKIAMMIGYSGTGYKGMQLNDKEKTIEGDLFRAFVLAGAVSKANADDPKKSSLVRCARTDKGVHAAGNLISLKMIVEDQDIVEKINSHLPPQIRVWGYERTKGSFNAYQLCDSRIYEYLIPSHCFLPPLPKSFLGIKLVDLADEAGDRAGYEERQREVATFWQEAEETYIKPILDALDPKVREVAAKALYEGTAEDGPRVTEGDDSKPRMDPTPISSIEKPSTQHDEEDVAGGVSTNKNPTAVEDTNTAENRAAAPSSAAVDPLTPAMSALKDLKTAILRAKLGYRIQPARLARVRSILQYFIGTHSFHNYTPGQSPHNASAKRVIKSFRAAAEPLVVDGVEWLSLKIHGQSFMMHQIRKMVALVALVVRCGCPEARVADTLGPKRYIIPKAPGLGLLLERPVFEAYNAQVAGQNARAGSTSPLAVAPVSFERWEAEIEAFKQREIYDRIFREEREANGFHTLFASLDNRPGGELLWLSSLGIEAVEREVTSLKIESEDEVEAEVEG